MALRKPETAAVPESAASETVEAEVVETAQAAPETAQAAPAADPKPAPAPAVRKPAAVAVQGDAPSFFKINEVTAEVIADASSGDFPTIVATSGTFKISGEKIDIGSEITFYVCAVKRKFMCSPNDPSDSSKEFFSAAYEGELGKDGKTIDEWVEDAQAAGFSNAKKTEALDVFVEMVSHSNTKVVDLGKTHEIVALQLPFMSLKNWKSFANGLRIKYSWGDVDMGGGPPLIKANADATSNKAGKDYTRYLFSLA